jgi:hypothetical protein
VKYVGNYAFIQHSILIRHELCVINLSLKNSFLVRNESVHHGERSYSCLVCYKNSIQRTIRLHNYMHCYESRIQGDLGGICNICDIIVCMILSKNGRMNIGPILNGYRDYGKEATDRPVSTDSNYVINNITTNITIVSLAVPFCMHNVINFLLFLSNLLFY